MLYHRPALMLAAALLVLLLSTAPARAGDGTVSGVVTYKGKPVEAGKILFHLTDDEFVGVKVKADGKYTLSRVPEGTWKVTIEGKGVPAKYGSEDASALKVEVKQGANGFDIDLK